MFSLGLNKTNVFSASLSSGIKDIIFFIGTLET
jgi:hypothetical protein